MDTAIPGTFDDVTEFTPMYEDGSYVLTVVRIEATDGTFGPGLKWVFTMTDPLTGQQIMAPNSSEAYEMFQFSSTKVTPRTKVYPWLTAFLGRAPAIGESGAALVQAVMGKSATAYVGVPADDPGGRQKILTIKPLARPATARPAPAPSAPKYAPTGETLGADDDDEAALMAQLEATRKRKAAANAAKVAAATAGVSEESYQALFGENGVPA